MTDAPQPPPPPSQQSAPPPPPAPESGSSQVGGIDENVAAALAYFVIIGIIWLLLEPYNKNRFIRFHSIQAIALAVVATGVSIVLGIIPVLGWIILVFFPLIMFVVWVICFIKAFQNQWFKLPIIGDFAEQQAGPA